MLVVTKGKIVRVIIYTQDEVAAWPAASITVYDGGFWTGTIAYEGRETVDERFINDDVLTWDKNAMPMPLYTYVPESHKTSRRKLKKVGEVHEIQRREYGSIRSHGVCDLSPGDYACGIELQKDS